MNAFLLLQGIETLALRVERHVEKRAKSRNSCARTIARRLGELSGFPDNPYIALAKKYLGGRPTSLLTFGIKGGLCLGEEILRFAGTD